MTGHRPLTPEAGSSQAPGSECVCSGTAHLPREPLRSHKRRAPASVLGTRRQSAGCKVATCKATSRGDTCPLQEGEGVCLQFGKQEKWCLILVIGRKCPSRLGLLTQHVGPGKLAGPPEPWDSPQWEPNQGTFDLGDLRAQSSPCAPDLRRAAQPCVPESPQKAGPLPSSFILGSLQVYCHLQQLHSQKCNGHGAS